MKNNKSVTVIDNKIFSYLNKNNLNNDEVFYSYNLKTHNNNTILNNYVNYSSFLFKLQEIIDILLLNIIKLLFKKQFKLHIKKSNEIKKNILFIKSIIFF